MFIYVYMYTDVAYVQSSESILEQSTPNTFFGHLFGPLQAVCQKLNAVQLI
jgi:hypothetical protein